MANIMTTEELEKLAEHGMSAKIADILADSTPQDTAELLEKVEKETKTIIFAELPTELAADILVEMDSEEIADIIQELDSDRVAALLVEMPSDDRADVFREINDERKGEILAKFSEKDRQELKKLLGYDEDSAGDLMTPELCAVRADATVQEAILAIAQEEYDDPISVVFVIDDQKRMKGAINISDLLSKPRGSLMEDVVEEFPVFAGTDEDQESIANNFRKYDLYVMPVLDQSGRLVGRITADDVMDVMEEEAVEDIAHMAGAPDMERNEDSPFKVATLRLPWLMITMFSGILVSIIIQKMIGLTSVEGLAAFVPVIMAMGGNTGMQASAVTVRGIALGELASAKLLKISLKEISVGMLMGLVCGCLTGLLVWANLSYFEHAMSIPPVKLGVVVAISMCSAMTFAALTGTLLPILLHHLKIDPALASGPFVTTGNDLSASMIYFMMCFLLLKL
ncbi:MAG: magnesium transporter [Kiritimatiellaeota bacterium]|nr:magnesium transporter [Kiritimatiellota bacterium]